MTRRRSGVRCPAGCGSRQSRVLDVHAEDDGSTFRTRQCLGCSTVFGTTEGSTGACQKRTLRGRRDDFSGEPMPEPSR